MYNNSQNSFNIVQPKCGNCRHLEPSPLRGKGWCRNPRLYPSHFRHLVEISSLDCNSKYRSRRYWEAVPSKNSVGENEEAEEVLEYVHPLITRAKSLSAEMQNPAIGDLGESTVEIFSFAHQEQPVWTDPGIYGYQKLGTPITIQTLATIGEPEYSSSNFESQIWWQNYSSLLEKLKFPTNFNKTWLLILPLLFLIIWFSLNKPQADTVSANPVDNSTLAVTQVASDSTSSPSLFTDTVTLTAIPQESAIMSPTATAFVAPVTSPPAPVPTSTPVPIATATPIPTSTPTAKVGLVANVANAIYLRKDPILGSKVLQTINLGTKLTIIKGPISANGEAWYLVQYKQDLGWVLERYVNVE